MDELSTMCWRRHVGVAHAEVDDVLAPGARLRLQIVTIAKTYGAGA